ncbi:spindle pole body interacting protein [Saitoella complicata NRRL Y-17804]|uniref:spindle pole body interacting protein n=1 Tax=Saitoella complicata (strain BCRC 22490 / CBS 7301 / JCM 7358 / NBRC 10748 / NRRL Y-17804) TaxID=698492 RepID=UPI00086820AB|nr:spindle pole body interacting protein [Saitoella complicata NRRL Y-17804]ODQ51298.1 spindle pole body interacting protein [Saitoella complicata NRRL Y-17804]
MSLSRQLAELMLPDQAHTRSEDWTIFFLRIPLTSSSSSSSPPPTSPDNEKETQLYYVLNLVNTKTIPSARRGAKTMAIALLTPHPFLHIYKPLLLLALSDYFSSPTTTTLQTLYEACNRMDVKGCPRLTGGERVLLGSTERKDMFEERFGGGEGAQGPRGAKDTHFWQTRVDYRGHSVPMSIPLSTPPEIVGDFSLITFLTTFSQHPPPPNHPHPLTTLLSALLSNRRILFLGHGLPSSTVSSYVLAAIAFASGWGLLRGFVDRAFPYTNLSRVEDVVGKEGERRRGYIAGVTNLVWERHVEWWDLLCDISTGRITVSPSAAPLTPTMSCPPILAPYIRESGGGTGGVQDPTDATGTVQELLTMIAAHYGEHAIRLRWRAFLSRFVRMSATYFQLIHHDSSLLEVSAPATRGSASGLEGSGWVWKDEGSKMRELATGWRRFEAWRGTESWRNYQADVAKARQSVPLPGIDLVYQVDRLRVPRSLGPEESAAIYAALHDLTIPNDDSDLTKDRLTHLLTAFAYQTTDGTPGQSLSPLAMGLFHPFPHIREMTSNLLLQLEQHEAGRHFVDGLNRFQRLVWMRECGGEFKRNGMMGVDGCVRV